MLLSSCAKKKTELRRVALPPANVLTASSEADWLKIGVPLVVQQDLSLTEFTSPVMVNEENNVSQVAAQDIVRLKVEDRQGKVHVTAEVVDVATKKTTSVQEVDAPSLAALIPALDKLAKKIDDSAGAFSTQNTEALESLIRGGSTQNAQARMEGFKKALDSDPNFGTAYFIMLQMQAPAGPDAYKDTVAQINSHLANFQPYDRARIQVLLDQINRAPLAKRTADVEALLKVAPNDSDGLVLIAGVRFLNGDADGGLAALNKAIRFNPNNPNLKAQLAEGLVQNKRFKEAEAVLAQLDKNPVAQAEQAVVILLSGDTNRANAVAEKFIQTVPNPDFQALLRAAWAEISGDRAKALSIAETTKFSTAQARGMALSEATVWRLLDKDKEGAAKTAELAAKSDEHPSAITLIAPLLVSRESNPADWEKRVEASPVNPGMKQPILVYGLFLNGYYAESAAAWRKAYDASEGADLRIRTMLAASLDRAGNTAEARKIKVEPFLIRDFNDLYGAVAFSEMRRLTGLTR